MLNNKSHLPQSLVGRERASPNPSHEGRGILSNFLYPLNIYQFIGMAAIGCLAGCAGPTAFKNAPSVREAAAAARVVKDTFVQDGKIIDADSLGQGGKVLIVPFTAGAGIEAGEQLDKIALMTVKGMADMLKGDVPGFEILDNANASQARFIVKGRVVEMKSGSRFTRFILKTAKISLGVEGRMIDAKTQRTVLVFTHRLQARRGEKDRRQLGYQIGQDIGRFILSALES